MGSLYKNLLAYGKGLPAASHHQQHPSAGYDFLFSSTLRAHGKLNVFYQILLFLNNLKMTKSLYFFENGIKFCLLKTYDPQKPLISLVFSSF